MEPQEDMTPEELAEAQALLDGGGELPDEPEEPETPEEPEEPEDPETPEAPDPDAIKQYLKDNPKELAAILKDVAVTPAAPVKAAADDEDPEPDWADEKYDNTPTGAAEYTRDRQDWLERQRERNHLAMQQFETDVTNTVSRLIDDDGFAPEAKDFLTEQLRYVHPDVVRNLSDDDKETLDLIARGYRDKYGTKQPATNGAPKIAKEPPKSPPGGPKVVTDDMRKVQEMVGNDLTPEEIRNALRS